MVLAAASALALAGCTGGGDDGGGGKASIPVVEIGDDGSVQDAVATITRPVGEYEVTVDVLRLKKFDQALRLEFAVTPRSQGADSDLSSGFFGSSSTVNGVFLIDTANLREYRPLSTGGDNSKCVCSRELESFKLDVPTVLFADFPLPPDNAKEITIAFPKLGPVAGVPIS